MMSLQGTRITWLGHATVLVQTSKGTNFLIDPFIAQNPKYPKNFVLPEKIHYILLTHGHGDHISDAAPVAAKHNSTVVAIYELAAYLAGKGVAHTIGMNLGGTVQLDDVAATMVEAKHSSAAQDERGTHDVGVAAGFVLTIADGPVLYHAGDTASEGGSVGRAFSGAEARPSAALWNLPSAEGNAGTTGRIGRWRRSGGSVDARRDYPELTPAFPPDVARQAGGHRPGRVSRS
jgi:L-ascorbate metabolism protein UlaG (beta-lactamase superfamily)